MFFVTTLFPKNISYEFLNLENFLIVLNWLQKSNKSTKKIAKNPKACPENTIGKMSQL